MFSQTQVEELVNLLCTLNSDTKIYIGSDSVRFKKGDRWYATYATVCVVHMNGNKGCRVFKHRSVEPDFDVKKNRPSIRLMNEVMKSCELYIQLVPYIDEFEIEIHCDVNPDVVHGSSCVAKQAAGYVFGSTGIEAKLKPDAFAASFAGDHYAHFMS